MLKKLKVLPNNLSLKLNLSIIIINYRTPQLTCDCLKSIYKTKHHCSFEVIVADNNSQDKSREIITTKYPQVKFISLKKNYGFAGGNNRAAKQATGKYLLFLNSDTITYPGLLDVLLNQITTQTGALGVKLLNKDQTTQASVFRFPSLGLFLAELFFLPNLRLYDDYRFFKYDQKRTVDFVSGACLCIPRKIFNQVQGFDERFFMYAEETDLCLRIKKLGLKIIFSPAATVTHLGGASSGNKQLLNETALNGKTIYIMKNLKFPKLAFSILFLSYTVRRLIAQGHPQYKQLANYYKGLLK